MPKWALANSMDLYLYPRLFEPLFRGFFGKAARSCSRQNVEFEQAFLLVLLDRHSKCMCHCVDTGKAQNTLSYLQSVAPFLSAKKRWSLVRENQQSSAHNFVKDFSSFFPESRRRSPLKKGAVTENPLEYGKTEVQTLFEPLSTAISSMELPKTFENKKLPNPLKLLGFSQRHLFGCSLMVETGGLEPSTSCV